MKINSKLFTKRIAIITSACMFSGCSTYALYRNDLLNKHKLKLGTKSVYRISNLIYTASIMSLDYGFNLYLSRKFDSNDQVIKSLNIKLQKLQEDQERDTISMMECNLAGKDNHIWQQKIAINRNRMDEVTDAIANISLNQNENIYKNLHIRNATRLYEMCANNGGLYIKLGQHLAMLDYMLPPEYLDILSNLLSKTPQSSFESVQRVFQEEFGNSPQVLFDSFDEIPIASASLAQVHVAYMNGVKYAVKIQHEGLIESASMDMLVITTIISLVSYLFKDFNYAWLAKEMNFNVPQELDFTNEKENSLRCQSQLHELISKGDVVIPKIIEKLSSKRIITMSFEDGCYVSDAAQMENLGLNKEMIAHTISLLFYKQIFEYGFVHCDPHPANILVRRHPTVKGRTQVVLLDHGLYRYLNDEFRHNYCKLWQGLILSSEKQIEEYCRKMNAGIAYTLLAAMITQKPWDDIVSNDLNRMRNKGNLSEAVLLKSYAKKYMKEIVSLLGCVPSELLILFKTSDCLRHLDKMLGKPINTTIVAADVVSDVLFWEDMSDIWMHLDGLYSAKRTIINLIQAMWMWYEVKVRIFAIWLWSNLSSFTYQMI